jgi:uncharacterized membrane protein YqjE
MTDAQPGTGLFASIERLFATILGLVRTRLELVSVELEEQVEYLITVLLWSIGGFFLAVVTTLLAALTIIIGFWETHRLLAAALVTAAFALTSVCIYWRIRSLLIARPRLFSGSLAELDDDTKALDGRRP